MTVLLCIGIASLMLGALVYVTDRAGSHALLIPAAATMSGAHLFGKVGYWLPSLVHPLAFSLFTAALLAREPRWEYGACAFWFVLNVAFEVGQHPQVRGKLVDALQRVGSNGYRIRALENYFLLGTFDVADLIASAVGATLAAFILKFVSRPSS